MIFTRTSRIWQSVARNLTICAAALVSTPAVFANNSPAPSMTKPESKEEIILAGGCFWCIDAAIRQLDGVISATSGYEGGTKENPTYEDVCTGNTGHAEAVKVVFNPKVLPLPKLLDFFWKLHDPTTKNRQGADVGTQYRSGIFYYTEEQKVIAEAAKAKAQANFPAPIVTEITKAKTFWPAEAYHQDYYELNKTKNPYCRSVIEPKLEKLNLKH